MADAAPLSAVLISGARVFTLEGDVHLPPELDVLVVGNRIAAIRKGISADIRAGRRPPELPAGTPLETVDALGKLVLPGFVSAHYHSLQRAGLENAEHVDRQFLIAAQSQRRGVHHLEIFDNGLVKGQALVTYRAFIFFRIGAVDAVHFCGF